MWGTGTTLWPYVDSHSASAREPWTAAEGTWDVHDQLQQNNFLTLAMPCQTFNRPNDICGFYRFDHPANLEFYP
jgi:hypothetical protein